METIDNKIHQLLAVTSNFLYIEYYSHANALCYKIDNPYTDFKKDIVVLNTVDEGFESALDLAIKIITLRLDKYNG